MTADRLIVAAVLVAICAAFLAGSYAIYGILNRLTAANHRRRNRT